MSQPPTDPASAERPLVDRLAELRRRVEDAREAVLKRYAGGASGRQLASLNAGLLNEFVSVTFEEVVAGLPPSVQQQLRANSAIVAVGGTGRGELCPYSDLDLLFLHDLPGEAAHSRAVSQFVRDCWDAGLKLGHSVQSLAEALQMARQDIHFATGLIDCRGLWGSTALPLRLAQLFRRKIVRARSNQFIADCVAARAAERDQYGSTTLQLEPDVKRSLGGLRDVHLMRWIGYARYGLSDLESLRWQGALSNEDLISVVQAYDAVLLIRVDLHLAAHRPNDVLTRDDQIRLATARQVVPLPGQLPVERFMTDYFRLSSIVADVSQRFVQRNLRRPWAERFLTRLISFRVAGIYRVGMRELQIPARLRATALDSLSGVMQTYLQAARFKVTLAPELELYIQQRLPNLGTHLDAQTSAAFFELLGTPGTLGLLLRSMYRVGLLELALPCFRHVRCLLQFNQYHSYTVDEHTLRAVEAAEQLALDDGAIGRAYRECSEKGVLFLALLLHDAGKGYPEDHSEVGKRLAEEVATRLGLPRLTRERLVFLVHKHLMMAHLAFRRNTSDPEVLIRFSRDVGSPQALRLLLVLTVADMTAVGPGVWNRWKSDLLTSLYEQSLEWLTGRADPIDLVARQQRMVDQVVAAIQADHAAWRRLLASVPGVSDGAAARSDADQKLAARLRDTLNRFPPHYLLETAPAQIGHDVQRVLLRQLEEVDTSGVYQPETQTVEYRVITSERVAPGCFHKLTGVLSSQGMEILSAQICTSSDGIIIDAFRVIDHDHAGAVPVFRIEAISQLIGRALRGEVDVDELFKSRRRFGPQSQVLQISNLEPRVVIDDQTSERNTVVDVFAQDRPGLLYVIARTLYELRLSVILAKISTHLDQVLDVFYVTELNGQKLTNELRASEVQERLMQVISAAGLSGEIPIPAAIPPGVEPDSRA